MQEQNLEEWKEKIDRSAEQITVPDTLRPGAVQQMLEERKNRTSAGRKEHRHYRRFAGIAAAVAVLVIAVGTYGWNKYGTDDAQPKKAALSVTETVDSTQDTEKKEQIGAFTLAKSYQDVYAAVQKKSNSQKELAEGTVDDLFFVEDTGSAEAKKESSGTHSDTNLQVNGVDEGDIVKNDGNYLYVLNDDRVTIVDIRDKNMRKLSEIRPELTENDILLQLYVDNDRLYVIKQGWETQQEEIQSDSTEADNDSGFIGCYKDIAYEPDGNVSTVLLTYDISERANPVLSATMKMDGAYQSSRKVGNFIYLFTDRWVSRDGKNWKAQVIPEIAGKKADAGCFYVQKNGTTEVIMASVNLKEPSKAADHMVLLDSGRQVYMGTDAIYLYQMEYERGEKTKIAKFSYKNGMFSAIAETTVKGAIRDTFAISESGGELRILTTDSQNSLSGNRLYLLDADLKKEGLLENIAKGEEIYAARYLGNIAYFITYHNTDPLFAVDISDPAHPKPLGNVKMTGYSDYLHPFGDGLLLGIGYETDAKTSEKTGVKLTMFDISDPINLRILDSVTINEDFCSAAENYKCAFVDTGRGLVGFATETWTKTNYNRYMLFQWDGTSFVKKISLKRTQQKMDTWTGAEQMRGLSSGDRFYVLHVERDDFSLISYDMKNDFQEIETQKY